MQLNHIIINVKSLEESLRFYEEIFDMKVVRDLRPFGEEMVCLADRKNDFQIELIEAKDDCFCGSGLSLAWQCDDLDMEYDRLKELRLRTSDIISVMEDIRYFYVEDPNGILIQIR